MDRIDVMRAGRLQAGGKTPGIIREKAFETDSVLVSKSYVDPGTTSSWHHHGRRRLYGYVVSGRLRLEYGPKGEEAVEVGAGDFFHIPPGLVHRDVNSERSDKAIITNILMGEGPAIVNVDGPA